MALMHGFRGQLYDDAAEPLYCTTTDGWAFNRISRQWVTAESLAAAMNAADYIPVTEFVTPGVGGVEIGIPSTEWQDNNNEHPFWGSQVGGREWGDPGVVFPTGGGGGGGGPVDPIKGPFSAFGTDFWIDTASCMVGFDVDSDPEADVWLDGMEVCESDIEDRVKMAISAQLEACGCNALPCMTAGGKVQKAYQQAAKEGGDE